MPARAKIAVPALSQAYVREIFNYDPSTGVLSWRVYRSNNARPGDIAGRKENSRGGLVIELNYRRYAVASIIWVWMTDYWPEPPDEMVDHINRNNLDNSWSNLRLATTAQNNLNTRKRIDNTTGYKGVHWNKERQLYTASIRINTKLIYLGAFSSAEDAYHAYREAVIKYRGEEFAG